MSSRDYGVFLGKAGPGYVRDPAHAAAASTSPLFGDPLGDFVHGADLTAEFFQVVVHQRKLFGPALQAPNGAGHGPHCLPHPAQEAGTLFPVRLQFLAEEEKMSGGEAGLRGGVQGERPTCAVRKTRRCRLWDRTGCSEILLRKPCRAFLLVSMKSTLKRSTIPFMTNFSGSG